MNHDQTFRLVLIIGAVILFPIVLSDAKGGGGLLERFGEQYRAYMARTGRFLPRVSP
jgi:protein-S-isoprenylcysteine O-methyltransferase Ste14